jgi:spore germination cell wall hydrolase CwlJ-like protein
MASPVEWHELAFVSDTAQEPELLGFEIAGESFPGSAFYYLEDEPLLPADYELTQTITGEAEARDWKAFAKPFAFSGSAQDSQRALQCMTMAIYYEAALEPDAGQRAVAQVVLNRVAHPTYPNTVCGVVFQGSERQTGCQFSFTCDGSLARKPSQRFWDRAHKVAKAAISGSVYQPAGLATHYHTTQIHPYWADSLDGLGTIGAHRFYRWKGMAGLPEAFSSAYRGGEPVAAPHQRLAVANAPQSLDPIELARAYEASHPTASAAANVAATATRSTSSAPRQPAPDYAPEIRQRGGDALFTADELPLSGSVKPEYAQSGQWISTP